MRINIDKSYRASYEKVFFDMQNMRNPGCFDEAALPSYTHSNILMSRLFWNRIKTVMELAGDVRGASVLDFGCGGGVTFLYLHKQNCQITGCENQFTELSEEVCRRLGIKVSIRKNIFELEGKFDTILALDVLEHVSDLERIVIKLKDLLSEQGQLIVSGPTENILYKLGRRMAGFSGHYHVRNIYDIEKQCQNVGLQKATIKTLYWPIPLFRISRWKKHKEGLSR